MLESNVKINKTESRLPMGGAFFVGLGIFLSRLFGLLREKIFAHYFGNSLAADAFKTALRIPNFLQNLLGEGVLSASFIPVYAQLLAEKKEEEARQLVSVVASFLFVVTSIMVVVGLSLTPYLVDWIAPGFSGERRELTEKMVYIFFPAVGVLVLSAFCLGILNSHRRFFVPYVAPVLWNLTLIFSMVYFGEGRDQKSLVIFVAWGMLIGSFLQFGIQIPLTLKLVKSMGVNFNYKNVHFQTIWINFFPAVLSRGVVQVSSFIDSILASWLVTGSVAVLSYAQILYLLPISLFGMSISASELAEMSRSVGNETEKIQILVHRLEKSLKRMSFFIIPSMVGFLILGKEVLRILYRGGSFLEKDVQVVWIVLVGYTFSLISSAEGRLFNSTFYSLKDTKTPLKISSFQVLTSTTLGILGIYVVQKVFFIEALWTPLVLTMASSVGSWVGWFESRKKLRKRLGSFPDLTKPKMKIFGIAILAALFAVVTRQGFQYLGHFVLRPIPDFLLALGALMVYGVFYLGLAAQFKLIVSLKNPFRKGS